MEIEMPSSLNAHDSSSAPKKMVLMSYTRRAILLRMSFDAIETNLVSLVEKTCLRTRARANYRSFIGAKLSMSDLEDLPPTPA